MKIAILGDAHFLVRNGSKSFNSYFEKFYETVFFPHLVNNNIKTVVQLGDIFDNRKTTHLQGLSECKKYFFDKFEEFDIELITLVGNHDSFFKDTISVNSPKLLLGEYKKIKIIEQPTTTSISNSSLDMTFVPWICKENYDDVINEINSSKSDICFGHLELRDFAMHKGIVSDEGMEPSIFDKFEFVFTGHYHHRSNRGNIYYLGTPYELTWHDNSDPKGFHIFDLETRELEFIQNPYNMFNKIYYDDLISEEVIKDQLENSKLEEYHGSYIKVIVKNKENPYLFDLFIDAIYKINPIDLVIIEDMSEILSEEINDVDETEDTLTILSKYVDNIKAKDLDSNKLKGILNNLYNEAVNLDSV
jgi:DNA repair exonuclease SbcCD nuclease subunit